MEITNKLKKNQQYLSTQQMKTLNGLIKSDDITGAMNGLHIDRFSGRDENESAGTEEE